SARSRHPIAMPHSPLLYGERDCFPAKLHSDNSLPFRERVGVRVLKPVRNTRLSVPI
ncbi:hypothetical protein AZZ71_002637, partial [Klebsiella pneumoniae]